MLSVVIAGEGADAVLAPPASASTVSATSGSGSRARRAAAVPRAPTRFLCLLRRRRRYRHLGMAREPGVRRRSRATAARIWIPRLRLASPDGPLGEVTPELEMVNREGHRSTTGT
jgi:hypothetical protein